MKTNSKEIFGTYTYPCFANKGKVKKVFSILKEYRKTAKNISSVQWRYFFTTQSGRFNKYLSIKDVPSKLSERYKQNCSWQVVGTLESYIKVLQERFVKYVANSTLSKEDKEILYAINYKRLWFKKNIGSINVNVGGKIKTLQITSNHELLARKIFHHLLKTNKKPSFKNLPLHLDNKVAVIEEKKPNKAKKFDYWIKLSTLEKGNPIVLPLKANSYAEQQDGEMANFVNIKIENNELKINLVKKLNPKVYIPLTDKVSIDIGLNPLFATDKGDLFGRKFFDRLVKFDEKITNRVKYLQKSGIKNFKSDKKYVELINRLRNYLKNEINRIINRLVNIYKPKTIVIENLDFRGTELSRRMNRLLHNFGKKIIKEKLKRLSELYQIEIIEVNPAYSSQECSACGYIDKKNRKSTEKFECKVCGKKINAQVNAARVIGKRSSLTLIKPHHSKKYVLKVLITQYLERFKGCNSAPLEPLKSNPYFRDYLGRFLNPEVVGG